MMSAPINPTVYYKKGAPGGILYTPAVNTNPYQKLLYDAVYKKYKRCIVGISANEFNKASLLRYAPSTKYLHLHWAHVFFDTNNPAVFETFIQRILYAKKLGYTIIWTVHNLVSHESTSPKDELRYYCQLAQLCDALLVHSQHAKELVATQYKVQQSKIHLVHHGSYESYYPKAITQKAAREKLSLPDDTLVFLFFGTIRGYKGIDDLLTAYKKLRLHSEQIRLIVAGEVQDRKLGKLLAKAAQHHPDIILMTGPVPDTKVALYFAAADVVALPFKKLLTSGSAILALSFCRPVIAPRRGSLPELLDDSIGILYGSDNALYDSMNEVLSRWQNDRKLGFLEKNFKEKLRELEWDTIVETEFSKVLEVNKPEGRLGRFQLQGKKILKNSWLRELYKAIHYRIKGSL